MSEYEKLAQHLEHVALIEGAQHDQAIGVHTGAKAVKQKPLVWAQTQLW